MLKNLDINTVTYESIWILIIEIFYNVRISNRIKKSTKHDGQR